MIKLLSDGVKRRTPSHRIEFVCDRRRKTSFLHPSVGQVEAMIHAIPLPEVTQTTLGGLPVVLLLASECIEN